MSHSNPSLLIECVFDGPLWGGVEGVEILAMC